jgi:hypothetical protein
VPSTFIDHTYRDFSTVELQIDHPSGTCDGCELPKKSASKLENFPMKLHRMISNPKNSKIIHWMPHGRSWALKDKAGLEQLCKEYFRHDSFSSFNRSVNGWGFKVCIVFICRLMIMCVMVHLKHIMFVLSPSQRLKGQGPDYNSYYHEFFLRGKPDLCRFMKRLVKQGKRIPDPTSEPNFYKIAEQIPLPPDDHEPQFYAGEDEEFAVQAPQPFQGGHIQEDLALIVPSSMGGVGLSQYAPMEVQPQNLQTSYVQGQAPESRQLSVPENHPSFNYVGQLLAAYTSSRVQAAVSHPFAQRDVRFQPYARPQRKTLSTPRPCFNAQVLQPMYHQYADEQPSSSVPAAEAVDHGKSQNRKEYRAAYRKVSSVCSISSMGSVSSMSTIECDGLFETEEGVKQELDINFEKGGEPEWFTSTDLFMSDVRVADTHVMKL